LRDTQRSKVYKAEWRIPNRGKKFETMDEVNAYVEHICRSSFWKKMKGARAIDIKDGRGRRSACAFDTITIALPKWARQEIVILHELTHTLVNFDYHNPVPCHGREFTSTMLKLVKRYMGKKAHEELKASFKQLNVHYIVRKAVGGV